MILLEVTPMISDGPAWAIAITLVGNIIVKFIPAIIAKWDVDKCKEDCDQLKAELIQLRADREVSQKKLATIYGYLEAIKGHLEKAGVTNIVDILDYKKQ